MSLIINIKETSTNETILTIEQIKNNIDAWTISRDQAQAQIDYYNSLLDSSSDLWINIE